MYCQHPASGADSVLTGCEHFGDNISNLACIQHKVSLNCMRGKGDRPCNSTIT
jgi:hypothetical protein